MYDARFYQGERALRVLFQFLDAAVAEFMGESGGHAGELVRQVSLLNHITVHWIDTGNKKTRLNGYS